MRRRWLVATSLVAAFAFVVAACGDDATTTTTTAPTATTTAETTTTTAPDPGAEIAFDVGVTPAPCPDAQNEGNGCIYLGIISDLSDGPFHVVAIPLTRAQEHFWQRVNDDGGLDGFDVIISAENTFDAHYRGEDTVEGFELMVDRVLAFAQILGTPQTQAVIPRMIEEGVVAAPATWWSGWAFSEHGGDHILESGAPYCIESMNGMAAMHAPMTENFGEDYTWALVRFGGDYGGDYGNGARIAASLLGIGEPLFDHQQTSFAAGGGPDEAVGLIAQHRPDLIVFVTGPTEMATITGGAFQAGHTAFQVLGASPTWNVGLLAIADLVPLLEAVYNVTLSWSSWNTDTPGHAAMRAAAEATGTTPNGGYVAGWVWQYPIKALLEQAIASRDLTRANVLAIARELEGVDYEGMETAPRSYAGTANDNIVRANLLGRVDPEAPDGIMVVADWFTSPLALAFDLAAPCDL
jgi:hypothetical protein